MKETIIKIPKEKIAEFFIRANELNADLQLKEVNADGLLIVTIKYKSKAVLLNLLAIANFNKTKKMNLPRLISKKGVNH